MYTQANQKVLLFYTRNPVCEEFDVINQEPFSCGITVPVYDIRPTGQHYDAAVPNRLLDKLVLADSGDGTIYHICMPSCRVWAIADTRVILSND